MTNDDAFMALAGVRYCIGRHSYAPSLCCDWLRRRWPTFKETDRAQIIREIKTHVFDEDHRKREPVFAIDVETWRAFLAWDADHALLAQTEASDGR